MKTTIIPTILTMLAMAGAAAAQDTPKPVKIVLGYNRPDPKIQREPDGKNARVIYWNDSMDHYDVDVQHAGNAYSTEDIIKKDDKKANKNYDRWHKTKASS